ncbi:hypothetical protein [Pseudomonas sp.]|jgi:hypothetical protein|uniref:hypothetical protein n=1 Tax=Pseudomonas sp. TaxID=306 RepID=UPI002EDAD3D5
MATDLMGGSFLATLELEDGTKLGFSRIVKGEDGKLKSELQDYLYASTLEVRSIVVEFRYVRPKVYVLFHWGFLDESTLNQESSSLLPEPFTFAPRLIPPSTDWGNYDPDVRELTSVGNSDPYLDSGPKLLSPWLERSSEAWRIGVDANGCLLRTKNKDSAFHAYIESATPQFVYIRSSKSNNYLKITDVENADDEQRCARVSDRAGAKEFMKMRVIGVYAPDGEIQFT